MMPSSDELQRLADAGELIAYFGYGSLVNPATHRTPVLGYSVARLWNWQRAWVPRPQADKALPIALLSSSPASTGAWLDGLLVFDSAQSLASLDAREAGYRRLSVVHDQLDSETQLPANCPVYVYEAVPHASDATRGAILQSYLDAVLQGYAHMHSAASVERFIVSTLNFDTPVLRDRDAPLYPRAVSLTAREQALIDDATAQLNFIKGDHAAG
ncbi:MAG: gamma-glutamylcyclotransferase family protein [Pseudomonadota bacterium]